MLFNALFSFTVESVPDAWLFNSDMGYGFKAYYLYAADLVA